MMRMATWWRRAGGLLAACLLVLFAAGPVLDPLICREDAQAAASAAFGGEGAQAANADEKSGHHAGTAGDHQGICPHGHCHHVTPDAARSPMLQAHVAAADVRHQAFVGALPTSDLNFGLKRPPRA